MHSISYINITQNTHNLNTGKQNSIHLFCIVFVYSDWCPIQSYIKEFHMNKLQELRFWINIEQIYFWHINCLRHFLLTADTKMFAPAFFSMEVAILQVCQNCYFPDAPVSKSATVRVVWSRRESGFHYQITSLAFGKHLTNIVSYLVTLSPILSL